MAVISRRYVCRFDHVNSEREQRLEYSKKNQRQQLNAGAGRPRKTAYQERVARIKPPYQSTCQRVWRDDISRHQTASDCAFAA
jgi:hypothetical protein